MQSHLPLSIGMANVSPSQAFETATSFMTNTNWQSYSGDLAASRVLKDGQVVHLTPTEWHLLELLARHHGRLVSQAMLLREVWGRPTPARPTTSASTWPSYAANSSPNHRDRATC